MEQPVPAQVQASKHPLKKINVVDQYQLARGLKVSVKERAPASTSYFSLEPNGDIFYVTKAKRTLVWSNGSKTPAMTDLVLSRLVRSGVVRN